MDKRIGIFLIFLLFPSLSWGDELQGSVRNINYEGHSFSVDGPPLQRVRVSPATRFDAGSGYGAFRAVKEGDLVSVTGSSQANQIFQAQSVKILKGAEAKAGGLEVDLNQSFLLEVNQKAKLKGGDLEILGVEVFDDLCKEGLNCEEGAMSIRLVVTRGKEKKDLLLTTKEGRKPLKPVSMEALGYRIELIEMGESAALLVVRGK